VNLEQASVAVTRAAAAEAWVKAALACIQDAQTMLDRAAQALCSVTGMRPEWSRLGRVYEQVKGSWYAVSGKATNLRVKGRLTLDHEPTEHEKDWTSIRWRG